MSSNSSPRAKVSLAEEPLGHTWQDCAGRRESAVPLSGLDQTLQFGEEFPEPIRYDAARGVLLYRGLMSHGSFRYLGSLSRDYRYQRALEELFVATATAPGAKPSGRLWAIAAVTALGLLAAAGFGVSRWMSCHVPPPASHNETLTAGSNAGGDGRLGAGQPARPPDAGK